MPLKSCFSFRFPWYPWDARGDTLMDFTRNYQDGFSEPTSHPSLASVSRWKAPAQCCAMSRRRSWRRRFFWEISWLVGDIACWGQRNESSQGTQIFWLFVVYKKETNMNINISKFFDHTHTHIYNKYIYIYNTEYIFIYKVFIHMYDIISSLGICDHFFRVDVHCN